MSENTPNIDAFLEELKELLDEPAAAPKAAPAEISDSAEISEAAEVSAPAQAPVPEKKPAPVSAASVKKKKNYPESSAVDVDTVCHVQKESLSTPAPECLLCSEGRLLNPG